MSIKSNISFSATISLAIIALVACQQTSQTSKEEKGLNDKNKTQVIKIDETANKAQEAAEKAEVASVEEAKNTENESDKNMPSKDEKNPQNLIINGDFKDGLDNWGHMKNIAVMQEKSKNYVEIVGSTNSQTYLWQSLSTVSGNVYRVTFKVKADKKSAFVIFRDDDKNKEDYVFTQPTQDWTEYQKDFISYKNGTYVLFLSGIGDGKYYFSDVSVIDITDNE